MSVKRIADDEFNKNLTHWFGKFIDYKKTPVIYDVGANWGIFSLKFHNKAKQVYAFEPVSETYQRLCDKIQEINANNIKPFKIALSDSEQEISIHTYDNDAFNTIYRRDAEQVEHYTLNYTGEEIIKAVPLDKFIVEQDILPPDIIKMDIEGAELFALKGARKTIKESMPLMIVEFSIDNTLNAGYKRDEILTELKQYDYSVYGLLRSEDIKLYGEERFDDKGIWNIVCIPTKDIDTLKAD